MGFTFSFGAFRWAGTILGQNGDDHLDISALEKEPRSNFWDHLALYRSTVFGVIDPNRPILGENTVYTIYGPKVIFSNAAIWILKQILINRLQHLKEK